MRDKVTKPASALPFPTPILIADKNPSVLECLVPLLRSSIPGIALSFCSSHSYAMHCLTNARYQVVVCGVQLAEAQNFMLLRQHRAFQSFVPFIVIAEGRDRALAKSALEQDGVEDIIVWPLNKNQLGDSVREAMSLYQLRVTIAHRKQTLQTLRSWQSFPPSENASGQHISDHLLLPKPTLRVYQRTLQRLETNLSHLSDMVAECERQVRARAIEHLDLLGREAT